LEIFSLISIELEIDVEYIFPIQLIARLSCLGCYLWCSQDGINLLPKMATNSCNLHANKQMPNHAPWKDYFFLGSLFFSHSLRDVFFSTIMSPPMRERATGRQKAKECLQKKFIEASVVTVRIEGYDIDSDTIHVMESIFDNLMVSYIKN
jgi:hypothetical protein